MSAHSLRASLPVVLLIALVLVLASSNAAQVSADARCKPVWGTVKMHSVACTEVGQYGCAEGTVWGSLNGSVTLTKPWMSAPPPESGAPFLFTGGIATFDLQGGTLVTTDSVVVQLAEDPQYAEVDTVVDGTGRYKGATGTLIASGTANLDLGTATGTYSGKICLP